MPFKDTMFVINYNHAGFDITTPCLPKDKRKRRRIKRRIRQAKEAYKELMGGVTIYGKRTKFATL